MSTTTAEKDSTQQINLGKLNDELKTAYSSLDTQQAGKRLYAKDATFWKTDEVNVKSINNRLGWLITPEDYLKKTSELTDFATQIKNEGFTHVVLLGMGGSSLCSEVARETFGSADGYPELLVLDNTDPAAILHIENYINLERTLFIVASKSGGTTEVLSFFKYYYGELEKVSKGKAGNNFIAITDEGTPLVKIAADHNFRKTFINPGDIGGRYSVLSYFGLLPMALIGVDIKTLLTAANQLSPNHAMVTPVSANPGISLGAAMGVAQRNGKDKLTFTLSSSIQSFGLWAEQLIAESTGKEGKGVIPIAGEELGGPEDYGTDRVFVHMYVPTDDNRATEQKIAALEKAGHPVIRINVANKLAIGAEFYRWELATAIAGQLIGVNPFDEPNVAESKKNTTNLLAEWTTNGSFKKTTPLLEQDGISVYGSTNAAQATNSSKSVGELFNAFAGLSKPNDYIALLAYFPDSLNRTKMLQTWRTHLQDTLKVATTLGFGPRYLHSTGQLHKGGPATGLYIILMGEEKELPIPGEKFGFATLQQAQALGDYRSLDDKGRRVIRIDLGKDIDGGMDKLWQSIKQANK